METSWQQVEKGVWPMNQLQTPRNLCLPLPAASPKQNRELVAVLSCNYCFRMLLPHKFVMSASRLRLRVRVCVCACVRARASVSVCARACVSPPEHLGLGTRCFSNGKGFSCLFVLFLWKKKKKGKLCRIESIQIGRPARIPISRFHC